MRALEAVPDHLVRRSTYEFGLKCALVCVALLLFLVAGCSKRRVYTALPPNDVSNGLTVLPLDELPNRLPLPTAPAVDIPQPAKHEMAILFSKEPGYVEVADRLKALLPSQVYRVTVADIDSESMPATLRTLRTKSDLTVIAIGLTAARLARDQLRAPVVFAQVFNYQELINGKKDIRGVAAIPPFGLVIRDWKEIDPDLKRVGVIVGDGHPEILTDANKAAQSAGVTIEPQTSSSDRETLYNFKRLAPRIDGLWLIPDDRILSPTVLRELLSYAVSHRVRVCVFSEDLLPWGGLMSATPTTDDIARNVLRVVEGLVAGKSGIPPITPLSKISVRVNEEVAARMGLKLPSRFSAVMRGPQ
jgi:ABC-type uncharacterized transport system substrate-binding protein